MSPRRLTALIIGMFIVTLSLGELGSVALGRPVQEARLQDPKASLEKLQRKITDVLNRWWINDGAQPKVKTELKLSRMLGPTEAKLTYASEIAGDGSERVILTFMIRYYDGLWTTTDFRTNHGHIPGADLMLLFDRAAAE
jgi:hypothetical protein